MNRGRTLLGSGLALAAVLLTAGSYVWLRPNPPAQRGESFTVADREFRLSGPYTHQNLTVFLLHAEDQDDRRYLTLDEGLDRKLVMVTEKAQEQVSELAIENASDQYLFLQEGDRLQGGKQDRIIVTSLIVPPRSGKMAVPSFCIERGRWTASTTGRGFVNVHNAILAPQSVRTAAKLIPNRGGQGAVWAAVGTSKVSANRFLGAVNTSTSLNEALDSPQVMAVCDECAKALSDLPGKYKDVVGVAVAVNGKVEEVNAYPNHQLFAKIFPRLIQSYAVQAALEKDRAKDAAATAKDVRDFMTASKTDASRLETVNKDNRLRIREAAKQVECVTTYRSQAVHMQFFSKSALEDFPTAERALGNLVEPPVASPPDVDWRGNQPRNNNAPPPPRP